jgi:hypothetical protein
MSDYNQTTIIVVLITLLTGVVASLLAIVVARITDGRWPDKDTALALVRVFVGGGFAFVLVAIVYRYLLR